MAISDKLQELLDIKQDIKEAIENKGIDLTGGGSQGETWVINENPILGEDDFFEISFTSNNQVFTNLSTTDSFNGLQLSFADVVNYVVVDVYYYDSNISVYTWANEAYRTITFETAPIGDLLTWLEANAVKQTVGVAFGGYAEKIDLLPIVVELTQAQYDALSVYDNNTYYLIVEA